ncbi:MAG: c-type cytochrome [Candidatus Binataceae bacterium]
MARNACSNWQKSLLLSFALAVAAGSSAGAAQNGSSLYAQKCAECHGQTGKGDGPSGKILMPSPRPFSTALKGKSAVWIETVITQGGPAAGLSPEMPPNPSLSGNQVKDLIQYITGFRS